MAYIRVDQAIPVFDGQPVTFKSPANCSGIEGLKVYYPAADGTAVATFALADAHGNNVGSINLFAANVLVKVILDTASGKAFVQNADTNAYLEGKFAELAGAASAASNAASSAATAASNAQGTANEAKAAAANAQAAIPTKTSQLNNDSGYLTSFTESDPTVPAWAKAANKPTYTASEVGARPNTWTPSASDVGARPNTWMPSANDVGAFPLSGGEMPGNIIICNNNPHLGLKNSGDGKEAYFQTYNDGTLKAGFGYGWDNSLTIDTAGNVFMKGQNRPKWGSSEMALKSDIPSTTKTWIFTLEDGSTVTEEVYVR